MNEQGAQATPITRRGLLAATSLAGAAFTPCPGRTRLPAIRIGVLTDLSGPYRDTDGMLSVAAVRQAVQDFGAPDFPVEVLVADHQNKPDVGVELARQWLDQDGVDLVIDVPTSSVALAVNGIVREKNKVYINTSAATGDLTGAQCTPNTIHWSYDTYMLATSTGSAMARNGGNTWYFITADYVFGQQLQRDTAAFVAATGGRVLGASPYPFPVTTRLPSCPISAQSSGAEVLALANAGADTVNAVKQAAEFGLQRSMKVVALLMVIQGVHGVGLHDAQGLFLTESFYWDLNDRTRAFTEKFRKAMPDQRPNMVVAGSYAGALHYLKAVGGVGLAAAKADGAAVVARMKAMPAEDDCFGQTTIRQDGLALVTAYLFRVKTPAESRGPWDYYKLVATTPSHQAAKPLAETGCPLASQPSPD